MQTAFSQLNRWVTSGQAPSKAPRLQIADNAYVLDANGNVKGGIRTPAVDVPVAKLSGLGQDTGSSPFCALFGTTVPFTPAQLHTLYPFHDAFVVAWIKATASAVKAGFILPADAKPLVAAASSTVPE
nr:alpha/beta hydrolase domain-containing protein [Candidatus Frankia alpina]